MWSGQLLFLEDNSTFLKFLLFGAFKSTSAPAYSHILSLPSLLFSACTKHDMKKFPPWMTVVNKLLFCQQTQSLRPILKRLSFIISCCLIFQLRSRDSRGKKVFAIFSSLFLCLQFFYSCSSILRSGTTHSRRGKLNSPSSAYDCYPLYLPIV